MLNQQRAAQTRFANDLQEAKNATVIGPNSITSSANKGRPSPVARRGAPSVGQVLARPSLNNVMSNGGGPQPVGKLGEFIKGLAQQASMQPQQDPQLEMVEREIGMEEFAQSPALQEVVSRAKLVDFFNRYSSNEDVSYAERILSSLARY